jgi:hypothetical protein
MVQDAADDTRVLDHDGALNEHTRVAISGYGPTKATVMDGGELFGKSR